MWKVFIEYCKNNLPLTLITAGLLVFILVLIVLALALKSKAKKAALAKAKAKQNPVPAPKTVETPKPTPQQSETPQPVKQPEPEKVAPVEEAVLEPKAEETVVETVKEEPTKEKKASVKKASAEKIEPQKKNATQEKANVTEKSIHTSKSAKNKKVKETKMLLDELKDVDNKIDFYEEDEVDQMARYSGKWTICRIVTDEHTPLDEEAYFFELRASNGEKLLSSEEYTTYNGALKGIETHRANILKGNLKISLTKKGDYIFKLLSGKNLLLCMGENYPTKARCESAIESVKRFAKTAILDENIQDHVVKVPLVDDTEVTPLPDGCNGKWVIEGSKDVNGEQVYVFCLYANNGEKLLSSEEYTTYIGAVNGIETHKSNIEQGNFRVTLTKRGDYIYKLLNKNGQLLSLGEHYKTKRLCLNAVESVKRFSKNSPVLADSKLMNK